ncbi:MAG: protein kinase [Alphaproteobacteria bacterium]|nr:protein kinase [Alphaproteobacteria bacterium]
MKAPGDRIGRFRIERLLGEGGVAQVYRVRHELLDTVHALKLLPVARRGLAKRLVQEGRIQAHLRHPNVVAVTDLVEEKGQIGLVMEFIEGYSLEECLREGGAMATDEAMDLFSQIVSGVAAAHQAGVLHRDLKPANVLLTAAEDRVLAKVSDFGIAKMASGPSEVRGNRKPIGTPGYMAPEQITNPDSADRRSDIFALGAILYEMLSGRRTFAGRTAKEVMSNTARGRFTPLREVVRGCPDNFDHTVRMALQVDPNDRFQSCMELARALGIADAIVPLKTIPPTTEDGLSAPDPVFHVPHDDQAAMPTIVHRGGFDEASPTMTDASDTLDEDSGVLSSYEDMGAHPTLTPDDVTADPPAFNTASDFLDEEPAMERAPKRTPHIGWGRDEAVDTWAPEDSEDGFALPAVDNTPRAATPVAPPPRRAQVWTPPGSTPATPEPAPALEPVKAPTGRDLSNAIAESLAGAGEPAEAAPSDAPYEEPEAQEEQPAGFSGMLQSAMVALTPLLALGLGALAVSAYGASVLEEHQLEVVAHETELTELMQQQPDMVSKLDTIVASIEEEEGAPEGGHTPPDPALTHRRLQAWRNAPDFAAKQSASENLVEFMLIQISELGAFNIPSTQITEQRALDLSLRDMQKAHREYHAAMDAWQAESRTTIGSITLMLGMSEPPPADD